jgi:hypothetical protein
MSWTTLVNPETTRQYMGDKELHSAWFMPKGWPGKGPCVSLEIPECNLHVCLPQPDGEPVVIVNQPRFNKNVKSWIRGACARAREYQACLSFSCDTTEQAEQAARFAGRLLPNYERVALERMYRPETRLRGDLS